MYIHCVIVCECLRAGAADSTVVLAAPGHAGKPSLDR